MEAEMKFGMGRSPPNPGSLFYVLRYPNGQRESKCVLAQEALSLYSCRYLLFFLLVPIGSNTNPGILKYFLVLRQVYFTSQSF